MQCLLPAVQEEGQSGEDEEQAQPVQAEKVPSLPFQSAGRFFGRGVHVLIRVPEFTVRACAVPFFCPRSQGMKMG